MTTTFKNGFGLVSRITDKVIAWRGTLLLDRYRDDFYSWDPKRASDARKRLDFDLRRQAERAVHDLVKLWVEEHQFDPETLCASEITIRFNPDERRFGGKVIHTTATMRASQRPI
ncbi:hypothetical protein SEA_GUYFAGIERI_77 [Rhodococcus phage GuyFagieri]|nr:hypothetical protein SEA_GUYFAGIERI_77 [Rhodococcus phage GuyFagieri]